MNRLIIIGNGFDLAHGLPTSYRNFIDDFWIQVIKDLNNNPFLDLENLVQVQIVMHQFVIDNKLWNDSINSFEKLKNFVNNNGGVMNFKNNFFQILCNNLSINNWVDIENEYYKNLKELKYSKGLISLSKEQLRKKVVILNQEFEQVKNLLEKYLNEKVVGNYQLDFCKNSDINWMNFYNILKPISLLSNEHNIDKEFSKAEDIEEIKQHFDKENKEELVNNLYFLNFNYTPIVNIYNDLLDKDYRIESKVNFIHGNLGNNDENKINFGFGDEMDDDYKAIENLDDNEYLKNFKSFQYLQNSNYNNLLRYIDSEKFQVCIMGHSCGLSDRTLLNTVFEHNNCSSIKVFYHKNGEFDNYTEIIQNISRHFNKKALMRSKIVNKTLCEPMPQIQLPKK